MEKSQIKGHDNRKKVFYLLQAGLPCSDIIDFVSMYYGEVVVISSLTALEKEQNAAALNSSVCLVLVDIRKEADKGKSLLDEAMLYHGRIPVVAVCDFDNIGQYTTVIAHDIELINEPLNSEEVIRRCNRAISRAKE